MLVVPVVTEADLLAFQQSHFPKEGAPSTKAPGPSFEDSPLDADHAFYTTGHHDHHDHQRRSKVENSTSMKGLQQNEDDDGLGYYDDGHKRTLTDKQIAIFRFSEEQAALRASTREAENLAASVSVSVSASDAAESALEPGALSAISESTTLGQDNNLQSSGGSRATEGIASAQESIREDIQLNSRKFKGIKTLHWPALPACLCVTELGLSSFISIGDPGTDRFQSLIRDIVGQPIFPQPLRLAQMGRSTENLMAYYDEVCPKTGDEPPISPPKTPGERVEISEAERDPNKWTKSRAIAKSRPR